MDSAADLVLLEKVADWADRYTPLVGLDLPNGLLFDIAGCAHLFGGEAAIVEDISTRLTRFGLENRIAIAGTADAARAIARYGSPCILPPGSEAVAVRPLPVVALGLEENLNIALTRAGLKTIGDLADRPRGPLAARFGRGLLDRLQRLLGEEDHRIVPRRPPPACLAERHFPEPVVMEDHLLATLGMLAANLGRVLEERGEGGRRFEARFFRADGKVEEISVDTGRPTRDPKVLMRLFRERLDALSDPLDPGFGFDLVRLSIPLSEPLGAHQSTLDGHEAADEEIAAMADRLAARFGAEHVLGFAEMDSHIPERASQTVPLNLQERPQAGLTRAARTPGWNETARQMEVEEASTFSPPPEWGRSVSAADGVGVSEGVPLTPTLGSSPRVASRPLPLTGGGKTSGGKEEKGVAPSPSPLGGEVKTTNPSTPVPPHPHHSSRPSPGDAISPPKGEVKVQSRPRWDGATALDLFVEEAKAEEGSLGQVIPFGSPKPEPREPIAQMLPLEEVEPPARPLYLFDPPLPIETLAEVPEGPPLLFRWRRVRHVVARAEGPERIAPEWWRRGEDSLTRDYYRVEDSEGRRFWLFREGLYERESNQPRWFIHGLFA
jgi:protein ImuB